MRSVTLSFACNNACIFCAQGGLREARPSPPIEATNPTKATIPRAEGATPAPDAAEVIAKTVATLAPGETVALLGGEPTIDERLPEWIRALDAAGAGRIVVQTNGRRLAYRSYARALREASSRLSLDVSITGSTEAMHDYHTGTPGSFKQAVLGLRNARSERVRAVLSCVVTRSNFRHLAEIVRLTHAVGATAVRFVLARPLGRALGASDRVVPAPELVAPYLALAQAEGTKLGVVVRTSASGNAEEGSSFAFAGLGVVETEADRDAGRAPAKDTERRALAIFGRPAPGRREERVPARRTGDELRALFPTLFDGAPPRDVADVIAADARLAVIAPARSKGSAANDSGAGGFEARSDGAGAEGGASRGASSAEREVG